MNKRTVADLPDYPSLAHLASALWSDGHTRGAAVLVGAGFSRNAEPAGHDSRRLPLWPDLSGAMAEVLYGARIDDAPKDPLRLAEEFRIYLGPAALVEFLREHVPDASWRPGSMHVDLMALPWADVLTTNYDTLLERASDRHELVREAADLAQARGPRVIKLHGSIAGNARLVITEEDYRTYPTRSAALVNTARQVFIENELCLLGFSGDDPNFLQWSGWVRDHLAESARRIYLVGSLGLSPAKRRLLESRNVAPIDFAPLTGHLPQEEAESLACKLFLDYLASSKPRRAMDWQPAAPESYDFIPADPRVVWPLMADPAGAATLLERLVAVWQSDMSSCPDWLVMPKEKRQAVELGTARAPSRFVEALAWVTPSKRALLLSQSAWRHAVTLKPLDDDVKAAIADLAIREGDLPVGGRLAFLRTLLREARQNRDESRFLEVEALLAASAPMGSDAHADLIAQGLLWARDGLDLTSVSSGLSALEGPDPIWRLLRAALHCECGETELAKPLVQEACADLASRQRMDPRSMWVASRRAWADVFGGALRMAETWMREPNAPLSNLVAGYDAENEMGLLYRELRATRLCRIEEPQGCQPRFGPGAYRDHGRAVTFRSAAFGYEAETVFRFADASCLPLRVSNVDVLASLARDALESEPLPTLQWHLRLVRTINHGSPALERHFGSVSIARLEPGMAAELTARVFAAVRFWQPRARPEGRFDHVNAVERLRVLLEILSRLIVRADPSIALEAFQLGRDIASNRAELHHWLYEALGDLLRWSLVSLPPEQRGRLALDCLEFPLPIAGNPTPFRWPEPAVELFSRGTPPDRSPSDARWRACVANLLAAVGEARPARTQAVYRLAYLATFGCLEKSERDGFGRLLWSSRDSGNGGLPLDVDLYPHVIAALPGAPDVDPVNVVSAYLFEASLGSGRDQYRFEAIDAAARSRPPVSKMLPTRDQAATLLDGMAALISRPRADTGPFERQARQRLFRSAGMVLGNAVLRCLEIGDLTGPRLAFVELCANTGNGGGTLAGLHEVARLQPDLTLKVVRDLRRAVAGGDLHDVAGASQSIGDWAEATGSRRYPPLPEALKDALLAALEMGVRPALQPRISCARRLLQLGALSTLQIEALSGLLPDLWEGLAYEKMPQQGPEAISITVARAECVRLAASLTSAGYAAHGNIAEAEGDPLPEVRFSKLLTD